jgi:hypothetical protein
MADRPTARVGSRWNREEDHLTPIVMVDLFLCGKTLMKKTQLKSSVKNYRGN